MFTSKTSADLSRTLQALLINCWSEGLKYTLHRADLPGDCALGVSNAFTGDAARICVEDGTLLIFYRGEYGALY